MITKIIFGPLKKVFHHFDQSSIQNEYQILVFYKKTSTVYLLLHLTVINFSSDPNK